MKWKIIKKLQNSKTLKLKSGQILRILLENRGLKAKKQQEEFLNLPNPYSLSAEEVGISSVQIIKAINRIKKAIKNREKIIVYGDYDADGICATAILWETLHEIKAQVMPFIPRREEGYGMQVERLTKMADEGVGLIVTVDQGIVSFEQAKKAKLLGIDVIITDHHLPKKEKPKALAIIHTTKLSGAGVAWFLAKELKALHPRGVNVNHPGGDNSLDLVTIGTLTDMVPLVGSNRSIVKRGLNDLSKTERPGLKYLLKFTAIEGRKLGSYEVGFIIGPRLNAAGRIDDPMDSLRLICTSDPERAKDLAYKLDSKNRQRQELMITTTEQAREIWLKQDGKSALIFVHNREFQEGIVGLVASKLTEEFYRPSIVIAGGLEPARASARSIEEFNIVEAIRRCADILGSHGGHSMAAGFSIERTKIEILKERLTKIAEEKLSKVELSPTLKIDSELDLAAVNLELYAQISRMEPFGEGNRQPVFCTKKLMVIDARTIGQEKKHLALKVAAPNLKFPVRAVGFGMGYLLPKLSPDKPADIAYNLILDEWNGRRNIQLRIRDIHVP